jgi:hypothetical protein
MFNKLLGDLPGVLPDIKLLVNHIDEPRVLLRPSSDSPERRFTVTNLSERPTSDALTKHCPAQQPTQNTNQSQGPSTYDLPLVKNLTSTLDLCTHPHPATTHSLFQSPPSLKLIEGAVPVLSTGKSSTMSDILIPSPAYLVEPEFQYNPARDMPWARKASQLYWAGSTTGGVATQLVQDTHEGRQPGGDNRRHVHRQRFLTLAQNPDPPGEGHVYLHEVDGQVQTVWSRFWHGRLWNVFPTRIFQCEHAAPCRQQRSFFRRMPWQDGDAALGAKLVFDLDGNGISGRFHKLLASKSLVLKPTLLREWHDERLVSWLHYLPVSLEKGELPESWCSAFWERGEGSRGRGRSRSTAGSGSIGR